MLETFATITEVIVELHTTTASAGDSDSQELQRVISNWESALTEYISLSNDCANDIGIGAGANITDESVDCGRIMYFRVSSLRRIGGIRIRLYFALRSCLLHHSRKGKQTSSNEACYFAHGSFCSWISAASTLSTAIITLFCHIVTNTKFATMIMI